jgi:solute carrier family 25 carnitine/acylcarnitine transporter 20/29
MSKLLTGFSIALFESFVTCPIERAKVFFMTEDVAASGGTKRILALKAQQGGLFKELFRGFIPLLTRQSVAWVSFLQADLHIKKLIRRHYRIPDDQNIPSRYLMVASFFVSLINVICVMPFDAMKTMMQKVKPTGSLRETMLEVY